MKTMQVANTAGLSFRELELCISEGGKLVVYGYCVSIIALTLRLTSDPFLIRAGEDAAKYRAPYTVLSCIMGWWGIPWGPIFTVQMLRANKKSGGGIDVTEDILPKLAMKYGNAADAIQEDAMSVEFAPAELTR
jgi:hypothetical protein